MTQIADNSFYIDRMFGFGIVIPVINGIVQEFHDHEYKGKLAAASVGKHINELQSICKTHLYKTWVKSRDVGEAYLKTNFNTLEYRVKMLELNLKKLESHKFISYEEEQKLYYWKHSSKDDYNYRVSSHKAEIEQAKKVLQKVIEELNEARKVIDETKAKVSEKHGFLFSPTP